MLGGNIGGDMRERLSKLTIGCAHIVSAYLLFLAGQLWAEGLPTDSARIRYEESLDSGLYGEAEVAAKELIEIAIREGRHDDISTTQLLVELALVQRLNGDLEPALQNYEQAA